MGNYLKMADKQRIQALLELGWSYRRIQRETGVRRETIARYATRGDPKAAKVPAGPVAKPARVGYSVLYIRAPRLFETLQQSRGDGSHLKTLARLSRVQLLIIDDFLLTALADWKRRDFLEVVEDRYQAGATVITSQCPISDRHPNIGDTTLADAICDRLLHNAYKIELRGDSMRIKSPAGNRKNERKEAIVNDSRLS